MAMTTAGTEILASEAMPARKRWPTLRIIARKKLALIAATYLCIFYFCGLAAPLIAPYNPNQTDISLQAQYERPSWDHWFGRDKLGRDVLSRVLYSARTTILFTIAVIMTGGIFLGLGLGLLAGYRGGWVDTVIMRVGEILGGLPTLILLLAITASFRTGISNFSYNLSQHTWLSLDDAKTLVKFTIIVGATVPFAWIGSARIVRSQALAIRESTFVLAAESVGASTWRILTRHILPGTMPLFMVGLSSSMAGIAGSEVALSFLGLGIDPPAASFGNLIAEGAGARAFEEFPHLLIASSVPVILFLYSWTLLGDALVDILEPRLTVR